MRRHAGDAAGALWTYAVLPYLALGGVFVAARRVVDPRRCRGSR
jgi:hypothetical protein